MKKYWQLSQQFLASHAHAVVDIGVIVFAVIFSSWLMYHSFQYRDGQLIILGKNWSDFGAHVPLIRSFTFGENLPSPEYPTLPGEPIRYHYLFYLLVSVIERAGFSIATAMNTVSAVGFFLLLIMIYKLTVLLSKSRAAGILAITLFLFNGTLSFIELIKNYDSISAMIERVLNGKEYLSFGPWSGTIVNAFGNLNIYLNQRHLAFSFGLMLLGIWPLITIVLESKQVRAHWLRLLPIPVIFFFFPLLHQAAYLALGLWSVIWQIFYFRKIPWYYHLTYIFGYLLSALTLFTFTTGSSQPVAWEIGFLSRPQQISDFITYWFFNLGLYLIILPIAFVVLKKEYKVFFVPFFLLFVIANLFRLSPDMINNHKFINVFTLAGSILVASFLTQHFRKSLMNKATVLGAIVILTLSGIIDFFPILNDHYFYINDYPRSPVATWIMSNTAPRSTFLSHTGLYNPVLLAGRKVFYDYGYFNWSMGYNDRPRRELVKMLMTEDLSQTELCTHLQSQGINYIYVSSATEKLEEIPFDSSALYRELDSTYSDAEGNIIISVRDNCS